MLPDLFEPALSMPDAPLPSMLLPAEYGVVPFVGRQNELADLDTWLTSAEASGARLVTGPGGQGKTRLAAEVVDRARTTGWAAGFVPGRSTPGRTRNRLRRGRTRSHHQSGPHPPDPPHLARVHHAPIPLHLNNS
jgi:hypothetical protein